MNPADSNATGPATPLGTQLLRHAAVMALGGWLLTTLCFAWVGIRTDEAFQQRTFRDATAELAEIVAARSATGEPLTAAFHTAANALRALWPSAELALIDSQGTVIAGTPEPVRRHVDAKSLSDELLRPPKAPLLVVDNPHASAGRVRGTVGRVSSGTAPVYLLMTFPDLLSHGSSGITAHALFAALLAGILWAAWLSAASIAVKYWVIRRLMRDPTATPASPDGTRMPRDEIDIFQRWARGHAEAAASRVSEQHRLYRGRRDAVLRLVHDMRTPLTALQGFAELTAQTAERFAGEAWPRIKERYVPQLNTAIARLQLLDGSLQDVVARGARRAHFRPSSVSLADVITECLTVVAPVAAMKGVSVEQRASSHDPAQPVWADRLALARVLTNLIDNAVKYTPSGGRVEISVEAATDACRVRVADTGIGIAPSDVTRLGQEYFRPAARSEADPGGIGLGLTSVIEILQLHGSSLDLESQLGIGSTFSFLLRREPVEDTSDPSRFEQSLSSARPGARPIRPELRDALVILTLASGLFCTVAFMAGTASWAALLTAGVVATNVAVIRNERWGELPRSSILLTAAACFCGGLAALTSFGSDAQANASLAILIVLVVLGMWKLRTRAIVFSAMTPVLVMAVVAQIAASHDTRAAVIAFASACLGLWQAGGEPHRTRALGRRTALAILAFSAVEIAPAAWCTFHSVELWITAASSESLQRMVALTGGTGTATAHPIPLLQLLRILPTVAAEPAPESATDRGTGSGEPPPLPAVLRLPDGSGIALSAPSDLATFLAGRMVQGALTVGCAIYLGTMALVAALSGTLIDRRVAVRLQNLLLEAESGGLKAHADRPNSSAGDEIDKLRVQLIRLEAECVTAEARGQRENATLAAVFEQLSVIVGSMLHEVQSNVATLIDTAERGASTIDSANNLWGCVKTQTSLLHQLLELVRPDVSSTPAALSAETLTELLLDAPFGERSGQLTLTSPSAAQGTVAISEDQLRQLLVVSGEALLSTPAASGRCEVATNDTSLLLTFSQTAVGATEAHGARNTSQAARVGEAKARLLRSLVTLLSELSGGTVCHSENGFQIQLPLAAPTLR